MTTTKKIILGIIIGLLIVSLGALYFWFKINDAQNNSLAKARDGERLADLKTIQIGYQSMLYDLKDFSEESLEKEVKKLISEKAGEDPREGWTINGTLCKYSYEFYKVDYSDKPGAKFFTCSETNKESRLELKADPHAE
ncbi:hypothetical protein D8B46_06825 [Candidatus Gracilibacteria bacterium]|nr:MAG: hypothetical protein D8B46_06825 [Candidatus Gracilibacteria bacterium]